MDYKLQFTSPHYLHIDQLLSGKIFLRVFWAITRQPIITEQMDDAAEFNVSNGSRHPLPVFANCSWTMVYYLVKICTLGGRLFDSRI